MRRSALLLVTLVAAAGVGLAGCGGEEEATPEPETVIGTTATATTPTETETTETQTTETETTETQTATQTETTGGEGDPVAGKEVFLSAGCATCHTLSDAGSTGTVGPNLDEAKPSAELVMERVTNGRGAMPPFKDQLSEQQIRDVAAYVSQNAGS